MRISSLCYIIECHCTPRNTSLLEYNTLSYSFCLINLTFLNITSCWVIHCELKYKQKYVTIIAAINALAITAPKEYVFVALFNIMLQYDCVHIEVHAYDCELLYGITCISLSGSKLMLENPKVVRLCLQLPDECFWCGCASRPIGLCRWHTVKSVGMSQSTAKQLQIIFFHNFFFMLVRGQIFHCRSISFVFLVRPREIQPGCWNSWYQRIIMR